MEEIGVPNNVSSSRAFLREKFLRLISGLAGQRCSVRMFETADVTCTARAFDPQFENIVVDELAAPYPCAPKMAVLRTGDVISLHFKELDRIS